MNQKLSPADLAWREDDLKDTIGMYIKLIQTSPQFQHLALPGKTHQEFYYPYWEYLHNQEKIWELGLPSPETMEKVILKAAVDAIEGVESPNDEISELDKELEQRIWNSALSRVMHKMIPETSHDEDKGTGESGKETGDGRREQ